MVPIGSCRIRDINASGRLTSASIVLDAGFDVGSKIVRKSDNTEATIKEMSSIDVVVTCDDGKDYNLKVEDLIGGKWKHQPKEKTQELVKDPELWKELLKMGVMRADVIKRIHETVQQCPDQLLGLDLIQKPKGVAASSDFGKGKLQLVPITARVEIVDESTNHRLPPHALRICREKIDGNLA